ncbi:probable malonyl-CoA-acyl carrier protein transacylase, mitochondrial [Leptidea sinapis]|uniref:probable malonyl-CoA-acyl carrier protein transacylase, mitochondrial n=1 Tax=Leptidea sinapis TaxID=189913 RepID=UPI0021C46E23|nr:probable malonyl-CoA-acyl carrier protein transacylase, mitochondrial [Leptidea sinapis]
MLTVWLAPAPDLPDPVLVVASYLYPGCKVLAGDDRALRWVEREGRALGVRRAARVAVGGAFHSPLMARAEDAVRHAVRALQLAPPRVPLVSCVDAAPVRDAAAARRRLARLTAAPVRWEQALHRLYARPRSAPQPFTVALGPGAALRATLRQVNARAWDASVLVDV